MKKRNLYFFLIAILVCCLGAFVRYRQEFFGKSLKKLSSNQHFLEIDLPNVSLSYDKGYQISSLNRRCDTNSCAQLEEALYGIRKLREVEAYDSELKWRQVRVKDQSGVRVFDIGELNLISDDFYFREDNRVYLARVEIPMSGMFQSEKDFLRRQYKRLVQLIDASASELADRSLGPWFETDLLVMQCCRQTLYQVTKWGMKSKRPVNLPLRKDLHQAWWDSLRKLRASSVKKNDQPLDESSLFAKWIRRDGESLSLYRSNQDYRIVLSNDPAFAFVLTEQEAGLFAVSADWFRDRRVFGAAVTDQLGWSSSAPAKQVHVKMIKGMSPYQQGAWKLLPKELLRSTGARAIGRFTLPKGTEALEAEVYETPTETWFVRPDRDVIFSFLTTSVEESK